MNTALRALALLLLPIAAAIGDDGTQPTSNHAWPPAHMRALPADYLDRLRHALQQQSDRFDDPQFRQADVIKVRVAIAAFALGQHVAELNTRFEADGFGWQPNEKMGFSLFSAPYVRLYALFNNRHGTMKGRLSAKAQANFERSFWLCAKAYSKLADAKADVWSSDFSENHHVTSGVSNFLVAQFLKDMPDYAGQMYDDGSTLPQQYEARRDYWSRWLDQHARRGLFQEDGSSYEHYTLEALFNLRDFTDDPILRQKADLFLDLVFANFAEETLGTVRGGPKSRTKKEDFDSDCYNLLFGLGEFHQRGDYLLPTSNYYPPPAIASLARDSSNRGSYAWRKRCPGLEVLPDAADPPRQRTIDRDNSIVRNGFATRHFHMGSHGIDTTANVNWQDRSQRWQGLVFANHPLARISMDGKSDSNVKSGYISNPFNTIQDRNLMVTVKWGPVIDKKVDPNPWIYFSASLDLVEERGGWVFVKSGEAYAAVKVVDGYTWLASWQHSDRLQPKSFVRLRKAESPVITIANDAADYGNNFGAFKQAVLAQPMRWSGGALTFATIRHDGPRKAGAIDGRPVNLQPVRLNDSPFLRSDWASGVFYFRKGDETLKLDFSHPHAPRRTVGAAVTPEFPPGTGDTKPIIFP